MNTERKSTWKSDRFKCQCNITYLFYLRTTIVSLSRWGVLSSYVNIVLEYSSSVRELYLCPSNDGFWYIAGHVISVVATSYVQHRLVLFTYNEYSLSRRGVTFGNSKYLRQYRYWLQYQYERVPCMSNSRRRLLMHRLLPDIRGRHFVWKNISSNDVSLII